MRETRQSGSEGGAGVIPLSLPLSILCKSSHGFFSSSNAVVLILNFPEIVPPRLVETCVSSSVPVV